MIVYISAEKDGGYRSGHNGAVLKTVRVQAHVVRIHPSAIEKWRSTQVAEEVPLLRA